MMDILTTILGFVVVVLGWLFSVIGDAWNWLTSLPATFWAVCIFGYLILKALEDLFARLVMIHQVLDTRVPHPYEE